MNFERFYNNFRFLLLMMMMMMIANTIGGHRRGRCSRIEATPMLRRMRAKQRQARCSGSSSRTASTTASTTQ